MRSLFLVVPSLLLTAAACGEETGVGAGGAGGTDASGGCGADCMATGGQGGEGGAGGSGPFIPTAEDVQFASISPMPLGEWIVFNDWNPQPNEVLMMRSDGSQELTLFEAYRVWSMGVSNDATKIAFSAGDPEQEAHFGVSIGDAIQPTFLYDSVTESATNLTYGNLNDECHRFGPGDAFLYLCRRYDFADDEQAKGYRIGRLELTRKKFEWLTEEDPASLSLNPEPTTDETQLYYTRIPVPGSRSIVRAPLPSGTEESVKADAGTPVFSPEGTLMVWNDYQQMGALVVSDLEGANPVLVATATAGTPSTARWSPDGARIVYLRWDDANACSHVEVVRADGSDVAAPPRIHDCASSGRFVTELAWIMR